MPITKLIPGRTPIREVVAEVVPQNGVEPGAPTLELEDGANDDLQLDELVGLTTEIERLEQARREAEAVAAEARARAEAVRAELEREAERLAALRGEADRLEEALTAQVHKQVALQEAPTRTSAPVATATAEPDPEIHESAAPAPPAREAGSEVTCDVGFWRGYRKAAFYARTRDGGEDVAVAESPMFRARGNGVPERTDEAEAAYAKLVERLENEGWRRVRAGSAWFDATFARNG